MEGYEGLMGIYQHERALLGVLDCSIWMVGFGYGIWKCE
jgi:hypothetical protein